MVTIPSPADLEELKNTPGYCGGKYPHALCPERAKETGVKGAAIGAVVGALWRRSGSGALAGAAIGGALAWYAASGLWWV